MKQPHTEQTIKHTEDQQNTGNHKTPGAQGTDKLGGTRAGAENVEGLKGAKPTETEAESDSVRPKQIPAA